MLEQAARLKNYDDKSAIHSKWLHFADEVFQNLESSPIKNKNTDQTVNLLTQAHQIISQSEAKIKEQEDRIQLLQRLATTDELTGLTNRRGVLNEFERELDRVNRDVSQGGLFIMIDLDNFKMINDTYGHEAGDAALKLVGKTLSTDSRTMDVVGRMGGDEFVLLFVNTTRKRALARAQFLIKKLNNLSFIWNKKEILIRASLGLKEYGKTSSVKQIFAAADANMYANKAENKKIERNTTQEISFASSNNKQNGLSAMADAMST